MKFLNLLTTPCDHPSSPGRSVPAHGTHPPGPARASGRRARRLAPMGLLALGGLAGCATGPDPLEASFGLASQCTRVMQTADPLAPWTAWHHGRGLQPPRSDGVNARLGVQHYRERQARPDGPAGVVGKEQP